MIFDHDLFGMNEPNTKFDHILKPTGSRYMRVPVKPDVVPRASSKPS